MIWSVGQQQLDRRTGQTLASLRSKAAAPLLSSLVSTLYSFFLATTRTKRGSKHAVEAASCRNALVRPRLALYRRSLRHAHALRKRHNSDVTVRVVPTVVRAHLQELRAIIRTDSVPDQPSRIRKTNRSHQSNDNNNNHRKCPQLLVIGPSVRYYSQQVERRIGPSDCLVGSCH